MKFLLDTDTCVFWLRGRSPVRDHLIAVGLENTAISAITLAELRYGADCSAQPANNHRAIDDFANTLSVFDIGPEVARTFGQIKAQLRKEGMLIEDFDLMIAATVHAHNLTLVTNNQAHFSRIAGLRLENWTQP